MDFFQEPFYNKQPSYYLSLDMVILITFFFKKMMKKKLQNHECFIVSIFSIKKHANLPKFTPKNID